MEALAAHGLIEYDKGPNISNIPEASTYLTARRMRCLRGHPGSHYRLNRKKLIRASFTHSYTFLPNTILYHSHSSQIAISREEMKFEDTTCLYWQLAFMAEKVS